MIPRYARPEIAELFTDEARFGAWLEVEVLAVEAWAELGVVPADAARSDRHSQAPSAATARPSGPPNGGWAAKNPIAPPSTTATQAPVGYTRACRQLIPNSIQRALQANASQLHS